jgi:hypothetical protein
VFGLKFDLAKKSGESGREDGVTFFIAGLGLDENF